MMLYDSNVFTHVCLFSGGACMAWDIHGWGSVWLAAYIAKGDKPRQGCALLKSKWLEPHIPPVWLASGQYAFYWNADLFADKKIAPNNTISAEQQIHVFILQSPCNNANRNTIDSFFNFNLLCHLIGLFNLISF